MISLEEQLPVLYGADCQTRVQPVLVEGYQSIIANVWPLMPGARAEPHLHVVHSPLARPTSVRAAGERHLIYDQYLGQVFNQLTRIALADASREVVHHYTFKLFGQRNLIRGDFDTAVAMAVSSEAIARQSDVQSTLVESEYEFGLRSIIAWMQECFALCHELVHVVIEDGNAGELHEEFEPVLERAKQVISATIAVLSDGELSQYAAPFLAVDNVLPTDEEVKYDIRQFEALLESVTRADVAQEAMCDYFGALLAADHLASPGQGRPLVYAASMLGLWHLRLLQHLDNVADPLKSSQDDFEQAILRGLILRTGLDMDLRSRAGGDGLVREYQKLADSFNQKHTKIMDRAMKFNYVRFASDVRARTPSSFGQATARRKLGFTPVPPLTSQQIEAFVRDRNTLS